MNIFSKKNRTRLFTLLLGGVMCASTAAGVSALVGTKTASADEYAKPETTKIETLVDARADLRLSTSYACVVMGETYAVNTADCVNMSTGSTFAGIYDKTGFNANNPVDYDGNVGLWINAQTTESNTQNTARTNSNMGFKLQSSTITSNGGYGIISFRTKWTTGNGAMSLGMMTPTNSSYVLWNDNAKKGYWIALQESKVQIVEYNTNLAYMVKDATYTNTPANGEDLVITYGIWQSAETARSIYLKVEKTDGTVCYENTVVDADLTSNTVEANGTFTIAKGDGSYSNIKDENGTIIEPVLLVGGIDEPLMQNTALSESKKFVVGTNLSDVTLSNTAYALVGTEGTIAEGTNNYDVKIANYYGKATGKVGTVAITSREDYSAYSQYIEKLETLVDGRADVSLSHAAGSLIHGTTSQYAHWNTEEMFQSGERKLAFYDKTATANGLLDFDGNVAVTADYTYKENANLAAAMQLNAQTAYAETNGDGYGIISFRTKYATAGGYLSLGMMQGGGAYLLADAYANNGFGYWIKVAVDGKITAMKYSANGKYTDITTANTMFEVQPVDGDNLIVSYGVLKTSDTVNTLYLKIEKVNADNSITLCYEGIHVDSASTTGIQLSDTTRVFQFAVGANTSTMTANPVLLVAGIDEPLYTTDYAEKYSLVDTDYEVNEDEALPTLPANYAWVDTTAVFGTSEYKANYSFDYYGKTISIPVTVEVNVIGQRVTLKLMNGTTELYTEAVKVGNTVNFGELTLDNVDTVIGWKLDGSTDLLRPNYTFTAEAAMVDSEVVYNVVDIDMKQYEKASIRTTVDANGNGGIRFVGMFNTADWTALKEAGYIVSAYGVIVPADDATYYTEANGFTAAAYEKGAQNASLKDMEAYTPAQLGLTDADGYSLYTVTMTNVRYTNYNRTFASMTYITVQYADGTATFETNVAKRSVYEVAIAAKAAQVESNDTLYSTAQMKVIEGYVANVIDVTYDRTAFVVADNEGHGIARTYALVSGSVEGNTVTLVLTAAADSLLATNENAPVWYNGTRYKAAVSYADGTATVTFTTVA